MNKKGQAVLESTVVIIVVFMLLGGITWIWLWANKQILQRQIKYNATRVTVGTAPKEGEDYAEKTFKKNWPVYQPENLKEEDVLLDKEK